MGLNLDQALAELVSLNKPTVDQLRDLVNRVDVMKQGVVSGRMA